MTLGDRPAEKPRVPTERGASAVEYALLLAGIAAVIVAVVFLLGTNVGGLFDGTCDEIRRQASSTDC